MNESVCISVIVPVYNTAQYLDACIASIVDQTYQNLQIILVNDGSSDDSGEICNVWQKKDSRICVIHQDNAGVSASRNAALKIAIGELIAFTDSDDILPSDAFEQLLISMGNSDLVMGKMQLMDENGTLRNSNSILPGIDFLVKDFTRELFQEKSGAYLGYLWDKLFRKNIIEINRICFDPQIKLNEDRLFLLEYLLHCNSVCFCDEVVYYYRQRGAGVMISTRRSQTVTDSEMTVVDSFRNMSSIAKQYSKELYYIVARKAFESALDLRSRVAHDDSQKIRQIRKFLRENARICMRTPNMGTLDKLKIMGHCILER